MKKKTGKKNVNHYAYQTVGNEREGGEETGRQTDRHKETDTDIELTEK